MKLSLQLCVTSSWPPASIPAPLSRSQIQTIATILMKKIGGIAGSDLLRAVKVNVLPPGRSNRHLLKKIQTAMRSMRIVARNYGRFTACFSSVTAWRAIRLAVAPWTFAVWTAAVSLIHKHTSLSTSRETNSGVLIECDFICFLRAYWWWHQRWPGLHSVAYK